MKLAGFIGRDEYIDKSREFLSGLFTANVAGTPRFIAVAGPGGIGKTKLVTVLGHLAAGIGISVTEVIDLQATSCRSELSLLSLIVGSLKQDAFTEFYNALKRYNATEDLDKSAQRQNAIEAFVEGCKSLSKNAPIVLILDTFEAIQGSRIETWLLNLLSHLGGRCGILLAGRQPVSLQGVQVLELNLGPFSLNETEALAKLMYHERTNEYDLDNQILKTIHRLARGHPILVTLAILWILEGNDPNSVINYVTPEQFETAMVGRIRDLKETENLALLLMATANRRFNMSIMSLLTGRRLEECAQVCSRLARFPFVKVSSEDGILTLHDEMLRLISNVRIDFPESFKNEKRRLLVTRYYDSVIPQASDPQFRHVLVTERIYYQLFYAPDEAITLFDNEMRAAVDSFEFDYCSLLLSEVERRNLPPEVQDIVDLNRAEMALRQYRPVDAKPVCEKLLNRVIPDAQPEFAARVLEGVGASIINPCTLVGANPFEAVDFFNRSLALCQKYKLEHRIPVILFELGNAYGAIGQNDKAEEGYLESLALARQQGNLKLVARVLEEMGRLYRLQQNVQKAFNPLQESLQIRLSINDHKNVGTSYYYLGNAYRDLNDFETASKYYRLAEAALLAICDDFNLCRLYCDMSWMSFLKGEYEITREYSDRSQEIAIRGQFGTELSENWHIAYEVSADRKDFENADSQLDEALSLAKRYNNIYMILDCLNHAAQRAYRKREYQKIPSILQEMKDIEDRGCGIRVFRGRAMMVYGDVHYDQSAHENALSYWKEGLTIVALYGNSRTNVELFCDILEQRKTCLEHTLQILGQTSVADLRSHWVQMGLEDSFPAVANICDQVLMLLGN